jgi:Arc/MetJ-type ribon-helix-helix transcriptional regulator
LFVLCAALTSCNTICYSCNMRTTLNISMPPEQKKNVDRMIKDYKYPSVSEFFRDAVRALEEDILVKDIMESEKEFSVGKGQKLRSLKDLG